ncbi:cyclic nucleotide-binding domain-containing protein [Teredinibacter waterburyi]|uniref:cyclic nucleotide-binding domain-containing protein n=1 Tax=Teredinibacter waterburyi TaxID=1500538 RepID=UPI00165FE4D1|nr:cyclic nucleotide-binding domain-containing protein [Teredinibacter waterburyi]
MDVHPLNKYRQDSLDTLLSSIPFYKAIKQRDQYQYDLLMRYSRVIEYRPGEVLMEQGQKDQWLYFLLKGQLAVVVGGGKQDRKVVNYITPGEVFGDLAVLIDHQRTATVVADQNCKSVMVFGTDFQVFGELMSVEKISLATKLEYYRNMVHNLRWKLEVYRMTYPDQSFASNHRKVKLYTGPKDTMDELVSLDEQARALARLLVNWNLEFDRLSISPREKIDYNSLVALQG